MAKPPNVAILSVLPSPYQRDLFCALRRILGDRLHVYYQQASASDSPWDRGELGEYETTLDGWGFELGAATRFQFNRFPAEFLRSDVFVVNCSLTSPAAQWLMRGPLRRKRWIFWGEQIRVSDSKWRRSIQRLLNGCLAKATAIAAIGSRAQEDYQRRFPGVPVYSIPYGCDLTEFQKEAELRSVHEESTVLFCGQMIRRKGVDLLLDAFDHLIEEGMRARLLLIGREGELPQWLERLKPETRARIEWIGFVQPAELPRYYAKADIFVLPSRREGWGVVVNQALGAGLPVVCTEAVGAAHDLILPGKNGTIVPNDNPVALADAIRSLAGAPELRERYGRESSQMAYLWSAGAMAERWADLLHKVSDENSVC